MKKYNSVYNVSSFYAFFKSVTVRFLRPAFFINVSSIFYNFFFCQHRAAFLPGRIPVKNVDHPLDEKIPFTPSWINIYLDFVHYWIRMLSFILLRYKRKAYNPAKRFIISIGDLYAYAAQVYQKHLSTTKRPFYIARPKFFLIHLLDPHLMCIPSLHVMVVIHTYTMFRAIAKELGEGETLENQIDEMKAGALAISQAILFVKQHSVNCIPAALYAMSCYSPELFPYEEAVSFVEQLFTPAASGETKNNLKFHPSCAPKTTISESAAREIREHILSLYRRFLEEGKTAKTWDEPLIEFLRNCNSEAGLQNI